MVRCFSFPDRLGRLAPLAGSAERRHRLGRVDSLLGFQFVPPLRTPLLERLPVVQQHLPLQARSSPTPTRACGGIKGIGVPLLPAILRRRLARDLHGDLRQHLRKLLLHRRLGLLDRHPPHRDAAVSRPESESALLVEPILAVDRLVRKRAEHLHHDRFARSQPHRFRRQIARDVRRSRNGRCRCRH